MMHRRSRFALVVVCAVLGLVLSAGVVRADGTGSNDKEYTAEQILSTSALVFLDRMAQPEPGYHKFAALWGLARKAKEANAETRWPMLDLVTKAMYDKSRSVYQRYQCCYVISDAGDQQWAPQLAHVLLHDPSATMRSVAAEALGKFKNSTAAKDALAQAAKQEKDPQVIEAIKRSLAMGDAKYTPEQTKSMTAQDLLGKMEKPEPGYHKFAAMWALGQKAKQSNTADRAAIMDLVVTAMNNKTRSDVGRWECCYVISDCGDETWVPALTDVLKSDPAFIMREVSAEALGLFPNCQAAHSALLEAQRREQDQRVLDVIDRVLSKKSS